VGIVSILAIAREGKFTALKFIVKRSGINLHKCVVHFKMEAFRNPTCGKTFLPAAKHGFLIWMGSGVLLKKSFSGTILTTLQTEKR